MHDSNVDHKCESLQEATSPTPSETELRLDALCELVDQELGGGVNDSQLQGFARRLAADVDAVMAAETQWVRTPRSED